ncbi:hypothetical protein ACF3N7_05260 [Cruoricaptor ignavus]|uniref:hypothetical protein n=1 Tax=Cruoricaptor ignavus TaxID=1118202 RepID=UPI00370D4567
MEGEKAIILEDTGYKGKIWGRKGESVSVVSISGNAVIVENLKGERFPCNIREIQVWTPELERSLKPSPLASQKKSRKR